MNSPLNILLAEDERSVAFSIFFALKADRHRIEIVKTAKRRSQSSPLNLSRSTCSSPTTTCRA
jgi:hypothetical protein